MYFIFHYRHIVAVLLFLVPPSATAVPEAFLILRNSYAIIIIIANPLRKQALRHYVMDIPPTLVNSQVNIGKPYPSSTKGFIVTGKPSAGTSFCRESHRP